jgi:hypothetical protein
MSGARGREGVGGITECGYIMNTAESSKKQLYNSSRKRNG